MENHFLLDLEMQYGLLDWQIEKLSSCARQLKIEKDPKAFKRMAEFVCENGLQDTAEEVIVEELRRNEIV